MTLVLDKFRTLLPKTKTSPSGWTSFNAPCCHNRGHARDTRKRAGVMFSDGVIYNCFNCKFTANWQPGRQLSEKFKSLCRWLGASDDEVNTMIFEAMKTESPEYKPAEYKPKIEFPNRELPDGALPLAEWIDATLTSDEEQHLIKVVEYVVNRGFDPISKDFYWTPVPGFIDRVILPYYYEGRIVGNTARKITEGKPKYVSDQPPFFVYNSDNQDDSNKYVFVVEGQFDALSVGGVALLTNEVSEQQARIINNMGKTVIVIPDQDKAGTVLMEQAVALDWHVAFPSWGNDVKDCADAVQKYGKLFVVVDAIKTATTNPAKIEIERLKLLQKLELRNV